MCPTAVPLQSVTDGTARPQRRPARVRHVLAALAAVLSAGCAPVGPDYRPPALALPAQWSSPQPAPAAAGIARWWQQFDDPELDRLITAALAGNLDLELARARLREARAARRQAAGALWPSLSASTGVSRNHYADSVSEQSDRTLYDAGFDASWEIDLFGGNRRGIEAARADEAASAAELQNTRVSLVAEVAQNYIDLRAYQRRLAIARDNLTSQSETLQITEWRYQAGLVADSDVEQARSNREQTRAGIPDLEIGAAAAENRLAVLLGRSPGAPLRQLQPVRPLPALPDAVATGIPADVLRNRPDLIAAERTLAAATARVGQTLAQRFPSLNLSASFGWEAYRFAALGNADNAVRSAGGTLAALLFDGGRLRSAVEVQSAVQEQALISYRSSVLGALEEVENALRAYAAGHERVDARRAAAAAARNAAQLSRNLYEAGLADFQQVLETERTQLSAEDNLALAEADLRSSLIRLYKALGGGWDTHATAAQPVPATVKQAS